MDFEENDTSKICPKWSILAGHKILLIVPALVGKVYGGGDRILRCDKSIRDEIGMGLWTIWG
jgi:hypothetical protein